MASPPRLAVLGSLNMDISVTVDRLPVPGATVLGSAASFAAGGKGANQAVAASRLGGSVLMAGCVGDDAFGGQLLAGLRAEGVDPAGVRAVPGVPSGLAMITVDAGGENIITVAQGANHEVGVAEVRSARTSPHDVLVVSAEIPVPAIRSALSGAQPAGLPSQVGDLSQPEALCVLNLAPAPPEAAEIVAAGVDWLVVNETEAAAVLGRQVAGLADAGKAAAELAVAGARNAVVTAGAEGAAMSGADGTVTVSGFRVRAVDSVGAGDTFVGALAVALAAGVAPRDAVRAAAAAGAAATTRRGTQSGMPRPADIVAATGLTWPLSPYRANGASRYSCPENPERSPPS